MSIDWTHFTPIAALTGGLLVGLAAALFVVFNGRIAGISGIVGGLLRPKRGDMAWRAAFIGGLIVAPLLYRLFAALPEIQIDAGWPLLIVAGLTSASAPATVPAAPAVTGCAACRGCRRVRWWRRSPSWAPDF